MAVNLEGYGALLREIFIDTPRGRWRYRYHVAKRTKDHGELAVRVCCEHQIWRPDTRDRVWEQVETWQDWYIRDDRGMLLYQGMRYRLVRSFDPWHQSAKWDRTEWPESFIQSRLRDAAHLKEMVSTRKPELARPKMLRAEPTV